MTVLQAVVWLAAWAIAATWTGRVYWRAFTRPAGTNTELHQSVGRANNRLLVLVVLACATGPVAAFGAPGWLNRTVMLAVIAAIVVWVTAAVARTQLARQGPLVISPWLVLVVAVVAGAAITIATAVITLDHAIVEAPASAGAGEYVATRVLRASTTALIVCAILGWVAVRLTRAHAAKVHHQQRQRGQARRVSSRRSGEQTGPGPQQRTRRRPPTRGDLRGNRR